MNHVHNIYSEKQVKENIDNQEGDEIVSLYMVHFPQEWLPIENFLVFS